MTDVTARQAFENYKLARAEGWLKQSVFNSVEDGRRIACALGVIDPEIQSAWYCPAAVMPQWLARIVPWLFDGQASDDAFAWGERFYEQLDRLNGVVPFEVVYDWHSRYSCQMGIDADIKLGRDPSKKKIVQELHRRAHLGDRANKDTWRKSLRDAYANNYVNTYANAIAYARAGVDINNCVNNYVNTYASAYADARAGVDINNYANTNAEDRKKAVNLLAEGLVECMSRVAIRKAEDSE